MTKFQHFVIATLMVGLSDGAISATDSTTEETASATGTFEVNLAPQEDKSAPAGRMIMTKTFEGDLAGSSVGQMISKRTEGASVYYAIEEFTGVLQGKKGNFTLMHKGMMSKAAQSLEILILPGSGCGELKNIGGSMSITQKDGVHSYVLNYDLPTNMPRSLQK
jgi:hypothetical protein